MKKYLMIVMAAVALGGVFVGCNKVDDLSGGQNSVEFDIVQNYENAFVTRFGQPAENQDWGFSEVVAGTRSRASVDYILTEQSPNKPSAPDQPTFRGKSTIVEPVMPTFSHTFANATYAKDVTSWSDGMIVYIDDNYNTIDTNKKNLVVYVNDNVTYWGGASNDGITFIVRANKTFKLGCTAYNMTIYLESGAILDVTEKLQWNGDVDYDWQGNVNQSFEFAKENAAIYLNSGSEIRGGDLRFFDGCKVNNNGGTIKAVKLTVDKNSILWNNGSVQVTSEFIGANENAFIYNAAGKTITAPSLSMINNSNLIYNDGTLNISGQLFTTNTESEIVNNGTINAGSFSSSAGGKFLNDEQGIVKISGMTSLTNLNSLWQNKGEYTTADFEIENTREVYNNCKLTVTKIDGTGTFHFIKNSAFVLDGHASVKTDKMIWDDDCDFYMMNESLLWVVGQLLAKNDDKGYGAHGLGDGYSIIKAGSIDYESGKQSRMNYWGKIYVDTKTHFPQGFDDPSNKTTGASQPHYYYSTQNKTVMFRFLEDSCPITSSIPEAKCHHGYTPPTTPPDTPDTPDGFVCRIIAEDLTVGENSDFDFNDVVFDVFQNGVIRVRACGGTLPLTVAGQEVHALFGKDTGTMINTGWNGTVDYKNTYRDINYGSTIPDLAAANNIPIVVTKNKQQITLTAKRAKVASKVAVGSDFEWCSEREDIDRKFHKKDGTKLFQQYVIGYLDDNWNDGTAWYQYRGQ